MENAEDALCPVQAVQQAISLSALLVLSDWSCKGISASNVLPTVNSAIKAIAKHAFQDTRRTPELAHLTVGSPARLAHKANHRPAYLALAQAYLMEALVFLTFPATQLLTVLTVATYMDYFCLNSTVFRAVMLPSYRTAYSVANIISINASYVKTVISQVPQEAAKLASQHARPAIIIRLALPASTLHILLL